MPTTLERPMLSDLRAQHQSLRRRYDHLLYLMNCDSLTVEADVHYAIFKLAQLVATEFLEAEPLFQWSTEQVKYVLPQSWQSDLSPHWAVTCPRLTASYDSLLPASGVRLNLSHGGDGYLFLDREFIVDSVIATVTLEAKVPPEDMDLLLSLGKIQEETTSPETRIYLNC